VLGVLVAGLMQWPTSTVVAGGPQVPSSASLVPQVLLVRPDLAPGKGATKVRLLGSGFVPGMAVTVGGARAQVLVVRSSGTAIAVLPAGIGSEVVRAVTRGGTSRDARSVVHYDSRVLVIGDSLGIDLGWGFSGPLLAHDRLSVIDDAIGSSGLVRSDYYDWPQHLREDVAATRPDVVVAMFGANDQQAIETSKGLVQPGSLNWNRAYAARVRQIGSIVRSAGAALVWIGLPRMGEQSVVGPRFVSDLDALDRAVIATLPRAIFVGSWGVFTSAHGGYSPYVEAAPHDWVLGHAPDGTHLTPVGASVIDAMGIGALRRLLTGA
jgi:hypothetical protein